MFNPKYSITPLIAQLLMQIEGINREIEYLPMSVALLAKLRETARLHSTHYSTLIEGNALTELEVKQVLKDNAHFPGRIRDEREIIGYYNALQEVEKLVADKSIISQEIVKKIHALVLTSVLNANIKKITPTEYRDGQNVIRDSATRKIIYLPPEAQDVPDLMKKLIELIHASKAQNLPIPLVAGIVHYQFATIHPYYDGNGRTARLLTSYILQLGGYGLKGLYSLEEYYARDLGSYYQALSIGTSHNYYLGRADADITSWLEYFISGVAYSFTRVHKQALKAHIKNEVDISHEIPHLNASKRKVLILFSKTTTITSQDIAELFKISPRTARSWCHDWVQEGFLAIANPARKNRKYALACK